MNRLNALATMLWLTIMAPAPARRDRGLSQSTENAILLAGAAALATTVIMVITAYVNARLPR